MKPVWILLLTALTLCSTVSAQPADTLHNDKEYYHFVNLEMGRANSRGYMQLGYAIQKKRSYLKLKFDGIHEPIDLFGGTQPKESTSASSALFGRSIVLNSYHTFQFGAGVAFVEDISRGAFIRNTCTSWLCLFGEDIYETIKRTNIGLPVEARYNLTFLQNVGVSFSVNANFNSLKTYSGFSLGLVFGRLRDKIEKPEGQP